MLTNNSIKHILFIDNNRRITAECYLVHFNEGQRVHVCNRSGKGQYVYGICYCQELQWQIVIYAFPYTTVGLYIMSNPPLSKK